MRGYNVLMPCLCLKLVSDDGQTRCGGYTGRPYFRLARGQKAGRFSSSTNTTELAKSPLHLWIGGEVADWSRLIDYPLNKPRGI